jgi:hypothetical protein
MSGANQHRRNGDRPRSGTRRLVALAGTLVILSSVGSADASFPQLRDVGAPAGLPQAIDGGYDIQPRDANRDGWPDLFISHHGSGASLYLNDAPNGTSLGFQLAFRFVDTIHDRPDRHGCAWGDVDQDGRPDVYCTKGARGGSAKKWNELWMQQKDGTFIDEAHAYGIEDVWGRGRQAAFLDLNGDRYPDLFVGNQTDRRDGRPSPNRTFVNVGGTRFEQVRMGITREVGGLCVQVLDINHDGWDDLLVCGEHDIKLYVRRPGEHRFVDLGDRYGVPSRSAFLARVVDLDGDGPDDLVVGRQNSLTIRLGNRRGRFGRHVYDRRLHHGTGFAVADLDGHPGRDLYVVQGCVGGRNLDDLLLLNTRDGRVWSRWPVSGNVPGCGRTAAPIDFDRDGRADVVVLNGGGRFGPGPDQLLTMGSWSG